MPFLIKIENTTTPQPTLAYLHTHTKFTQTELYDAATIDGYCVKIACSYMWKNTRVAKMPITAGVGVGNGKKISQITQNKIIGVDYLLCFICEVSVVTSICK